MRPSTRLLTCALILLAGVTACGGGSTKPTAETGTPTAQSTTPASTSTAPADEVAAKAAITTTWTVFFSSKTPNAVAAKLLEDGDTLGPALTKAKAEDKATGGTRSARVILITFTSPTEANVNYHLKVGGTELNSAGTAVLQDGRWKVSKTTFCTLVELGNNQQPVKSC